MKITIETEIKPDVICNTAIGVLESGYSPWLSSIDFTNGEFSYGDDDAWDREKNPDLAIHVVYDDPDEVEGGFTGTKNLTWEDIEKGIKVFQEKVPHQFANFNEGNDDAFTHDAMWQCIILGEVVYG